MTDGPLGGHDGSVFIVRTRRENVTAADEDLTDLLLTITLIDSRLLRLVREGDREIAVGEVTGELSELADDLRHLYRRIAALSERRDLSFPTQKQVRNLQEECVWLYRKAHNERTFFKKLGLEAQLRDLISDAAYNVYQEILWVEDEERRLGAHDDAGVAELLLAESDEPPSA
jgi:hypothetical protein